MCETARREQGDAIRDDEWGCARDGRRGRDRQVKPPRIACSEGFVAVNADEEEEGGGDKTVVVLNDEKTGQRCARYNRPDAG